MHQVPQPNRAPPSFRRRVDYPAAEASLAQALQLSRDHGDRRGQAWALNRLGVVQELTGDYPAAAASLSQALELFHDLGDRRGQAGASINLGEVLSLSSAHREARGYFAQALSIARNINAPARKHGHWKESGEPTSRKEIQAKALRTCGKASRSIGASEPPRLSGSKRPSSTKR